MKNTEKCSRIIFQPTKENNDKLKYICNTTGFSYSVILNLLLDIIDIDTKIVLDLTEEQKNKFEKLSKCISELTGMTKTK